MKTLYYLILSSLLFLSACTHNESKVIANLDYKQIDHDTFNTLLSNHVSDGHVDYSGFRNHPPFDLYIEQIARVDDSTLRTPEVRLSFLINAYNALAIRGILNGRSPSSFFGKVGYFITSDYLVSGKSINLYDLEHKRLRPLNEPRIHFALVCASFSCPALQSFAYNPDMLDSQLDNSAKQFINDDTKNRFDKTQKVAYLSKIFKWFKKDFELDGSTVQQYIAQYVKDPEVADALRNNEYKIRYQKYNWNLNGSLGE